MPANLPDFALLTRRSEVLNVPPSAEEVEF
jgi:hypothetical protein